MAGSSNGFGVNSGRPRPPTSTEVRPKCFTTNPTGPTGAPPTTRSSARGAKDPRSVRRLRWAELAQFPRAHRIPPLHLRFFHHLLLRHRAGHRLLRSGRLRLRNGLPHEGRSPPSGIPLFACHPHPGVGDGTGLLGAELGLENRLPLVALQQLAIAMTCHLR